jgi:hypothetical protein
MAKKKTKKTTSKKKRCLAGNPKAKILNCKFCNNSWKKGVSIPVCKNQSKLRKAVKNKGGRPIGSRTVSNEEMATLTEPYIKAGLSIRKSCALSGVERETFMRRMKEDDLFVAKILSFKAYKSVLMGNITMAKLMDLSKQVARAQKHELSLRSVITKNDQHFLQILMRYDKSLREEWGDKLTDLSDEEMEKKVQFDKPMTEEEADLQTRVLNKHYDYIEQKRANQAQQED